MEAQGPGRPEDVAEEDTGDRQVSEFMCKILEAAEHSQTTAPLGARPVDALPLTLAFLVSGVWALTVPGLASPTLVSSHTPVSGLSASRSHTCASTMSLGAASRQGSWPGEQQGPGAEGRVRAGAGSISYSRGPA